MTQHTKEHKTICIDPAKFKAQLTPNNLGERIFDEGDVLKFLIDQMNEAGVDIAMINHDYEHAIEYQGRRDYFGIGIASLDDPEGAAIDGMAGLSYMLNDHEGVESWTSYKDGERYLHIVESKAEDEAEKLAEDYW